MEEELERLLETRRKLLRAQKLNFTEKEIRTYLDTHTGGRATDIAGLNRLIADASTPLTEEEAASFGSGSPSPLVGLAGSLAQSGSLNLLDEAIGMFDPQAAENFRESERAFAEEHPKLSALGGIGGAFLTGAGTAGALRRLPALTRGAALAAEGGIAAGGAAEGPLKDRLLPAIKGAATTTALIGLPGVLAGGASRLAAKPGARDVVKLGKKIISKRDRGSAQDVLDAAPRIRSRRARRGKGTALQNLPGFKGIVQEIDKILASEESLTAISRGVFSSKIPKIIQTAMIAVVQPELAIARALGRGGGAPIEQLQRQAVARALNKLRAIATSRTQGTAEDFLRSIARPGLPGDTPAVINRMLGGGALTIGNVLRDPESFSPLVPAQSPGFQGGRR